MSVIREEEIMKKYCSRCNVRLINRNEKYCSICASKEESRHKEYKKYRTDDKEQRFYKSKEWNVIRAIIKDKDNGLCLRCLTNKVIRPMNTVHHIEELKASWSKRLDEDNLISLCEQCHQSIHKEYKTENKVKAQQELKSMIKRFRD